MARDRVTTNDLLDALREYGKAVARRPEGKGWQTFEEMAKAEGITVPAMKYRLRVAVKRGVQVEQAAGTAMDAEGNARRATYWRLKNGKP